MRIRDRQAAFGVMADRHLWALRMPRAVTPDMQLREAAPFWHRVFSTADPGSICAAAEKLTGMNADDLGVLFPAEIEQRARATLHPLRDLEADRAPWMILRPSVTGCKP